MRLNWAWLNRRKLRVDILTVFAILMVTISLAIIGYSYIKSSRVILELGVQLVEKSTQSVIDKFNNYIRPASLLDTSHVLLQDNLLDESDKEKLTSFMHILLQTHPQILSAYIADMHNNMFRESRVSDDSHLRFATRFLRRPEILPGTKYVSEIITARGDKIFLSAIFKDQNGNVIGKKENIPLNYFPTQRPWFSGALKSEKNNWIAINVFSEYLGLQMTAAERIELNQKIMGVVAVDVSVDIIRDYLESSKVSKNSVIVIVDQAGKVLSVKSQSALMHKETLPSITELQNPLLATAYQLFKSNKKNYFTFKLNHTEYIAIFVPYALNGNNVWEIGTIAPISDFIGKSKQQHQEILLFSFIMLLIGLGFVLLFSYKISKPIMQLADETLTLKQLDFSKPTIIKTHIHEIQVLTDAFNAAKNVLSSFAKYIPKVLIEKLMQLGTIAQVGGERKEISVLFSDIRDFTTIAEKIPPETLMLHLADYLNAVSAIIHHYQGNIDKFIGDAVMAFWGAPLDDAQHVQHSCMTALSCAHQINKMNEQWKKQGKPVFYTRFGLNTGVAVVGNMGSSDRLNYTAVGDVVNLALRLEDINKIYGTQIMVSEAVHHACHKEFLFRPVDVVKVKGKIKSTAIYELIAAKTGPEELIATPKQIELCELTFAAYEAFQSGEREKAMQIFKMILEKFPDDYVALYHLKNII